MMASFDRFERPPERVPASPYDDLERAIAERGLQPDLTTEDVLAYDGALENARVEEMGGNLMFHSHQLPQTYRDRGFVATERGLEPGASWREIVQSYKVAEQE